MSNPNFIDYVKIFCRSGAGGNGSIHFFRAKGLSQGGPDGGDGGKGGHIILRGNEQMWTLLHLKYRKHIKALPGKGGSENRSTGPSADDIVLDVPLGTVAKDAETGETLFEITEKDQKVILKRGGNGGWGNFRFKTSTNQAPDYSNEGQPAEEGWVILELKILADVGLVGFPNAGKSTLLSVVSAAKPEIADYAFTTLVPNLGVVEYKDYKSFIMADIPGIIEGAADGKGLGLRFLRHIERNSILLFIIAADSSDIAKEYKILEKELKKYNPDLLKKNRMLAISKSDMLDDELTLAIAKTLPKKIPHIFISSITNQNIEQLKDLIWKQLHS
ncbi:MAG: GTPase ObgE [Cytophagales bacterium]